MSIEKLEQSLARGREWRCPQCGTDYVLLPWAVVPSGACAKCTGEAAVAVGSLADRLGAAGVPARYRQGFGRSWWVEQFGTPPPKLAAWTPAAGDLVLWGNRGTGKTGYAAIAVAELLTSGAVQTAFWLRMNEFNETLELAQAGSRGGGAAGFRAVEAAAEMRRTAIDSQLLVLDELKPARRTANAAASASAPWIVERIYDLLAARYDAMRPTIITTNATPTELAAQAEAMASRALAGATVVKLAGGDRRAQ